MKRYFILLISFIILLKPVLSVSGAIVDSGGNTQSVYFTGDAADPKTWYMDATDGNPDLGLKICDVGQKYVGGAYAIKVGGTWKSVLVTYKSDTEALSYTDQTDGTGCYYTTAGYLTISPSHLYTPNPDVYYAAFPGRLWIAYEDSANPGTLSNFVLADGQLLGSYSFSRSFDENTNTIQIDTPTITYQGSGTTFSKSATDPTFGISSDRKMVVGVCAENNYGDNCYSGVVLPDEGTFPLTLPSGASPIDDQHVYRRSIVMNGMGYPICIGANLKIDLSNPTPNPVYYSQNLTVTYTITNYRDTPTEANGGNVKVTTDFLLNIQIYNASNSSQVIYNQNFIVSSDINPGDSVTGNFTWPAYAHSGTYKIKFTVDSGNNIAECVESDNSAEKTFEIKPIILPQIWINGNKSTIFPDPGIPYNVTFYIKNSDNESVSLSEVRIVEENGMNLFVPTQIWNYTYDNYGNITLNGTISVDTVKFYTDINGTAKIIMIPTGNILYAPEYSYTNAKDILGNYSIYMEGTTASGDPFVFILNGEISYKYPLYLANIYRYSNDASYTDLPNLNNYAKIVMNMIYKIFAKFWNLVT